MPEVETNPGLTDELEVPVAQHSLQVSSPVKLDSPALEETEATEPEEELQEESLSIYKEIASTNCFRKQ